MIVWSMRQGTLSKANNRCQKTLSNWKCETLSTIDPYMYKNRPHHKKRYDFEYEFAIYSYLGIIFEQKIDPEDISKFTTELEALQKPSSISEMNMLLEVVQLLNVTCSPMIVHMKKIWKKHQSKLTPVQKSIINALLSINTSLKQIQKLELTTDRFSNENPMSEKLQNMRLVK